MGNYIPDLDLCRQLRLLRDWLGIGGIGVSMWLH